MATRKQPTRPAPGGAPGLDDENDDSEQLLGHQAHAPESDDDDDSLGQVLAQLPKNGEVSVYRTRDGKKEFVDVFPIDGFSLKTLQEAYGGGDYHLIGRASGRFAFKRRVSLAQPITRQAPAAAGVDKLAAAIDAQGKQMQQLMMMLMMKQGGGGDDNEEKLLAKMKMMREVIGAGSAQLPAAELLGVMKMGMEFAQKASGGGESEGSSGLMGMLGMLVEQFAPVIASAVVAQQRQAQAIPARHPAPQLPRAASPVQPQRPQGQVVPAPSPAVESPAMTDKQEEAAQLAKLKSNLGFLVSQAKQGAPAAMWAGVIFNGASDEELDALEAVLSQPDPVAFLTQLDARIAEHSEWFASLATELGALFAEEATDAAGADPEGAGQT